MTAVVLPGERAARQLRVQFVDRHRSVTTYSDSWTVTRATPWQCCIQWTRCVVSLLPRCIECRAV